MSLRSYLNRPAKSIERLMLVDAFRRLSAFGTLTEYGYVGFGAHEFVDFELVWRTIGITSMVSIEREAPVDRFEFNRPFGGIFVRPGSSSSVLPNLNLRPHTIMWLDYTGKLSTSIINDVILAGSRLGSGSVLVITVNAEPERQLHERRKSVAARVGERHVPASITDASLAKWGLAELSREILWDEMVQTMRTRVDRARFQQLFNFRYADRARMLTWGGIVVADADEQALVDAKFDELDFVRRGRDAYELVPPALTLREMLRLNDELPLASGAGGPFAWLSTEEIEAYARLHRWYPSMP